MKKTFIKILALASQLFVAEALNAQSIYFTWSMDEHFEECARAYNSTTHRYDKNIIKPVEGWAVRFIAANANCTNCTYKWNIKGKGPLIKYNKEYSSNYPNLFATLPLRKIRQSEISEVVFTEKNSPTKAGPKNTSSAPSAPKKKNGTGESGGPVKPGSPTALQVDRFPDAGTYSITLTIKDEGGGERIVQQTITLTNYLIVCMGDSFNSGEGNPLFPGEADWDDNAACSVETLAQLWYANGENDNTIDLERPASWLEELAHRSLGSGAATAARSIEQNDPHSVVTFISVASSGADTYEGMLGPQHDWQGVGQIDEVRALIGQTPIDALLLVIGINDLKFTGLLHDATISDVDEEDIQSSITPRMNNLLNNYNRINDELKRKLVIRNVLLSEYPYPIFSTDNSDYGAGCELFKIASVGSHQYGITANESRLMLNVGKQLSDKMKIAAAAHQWTYVDGIAQAFNHHGYCSSNPFYVRAQESCKTQGNTKGTIHPNTRGHEVVRQHILAQLKNILRGPSVPVDTR